MGTGQQIALLRGINVGRAKRVAMADLRKLMVELGYGQVRTLLNSGNLVYDHAGVAPAESAALIEEALVLKLGVGARATVLSDHQFRQIIAENCLHGVAGDPNRLLVSVLSAPSDRARLQPLLTQDWAPEALAAGQWAAYVWCPGGVLASRAASAMGVLLGDAATSRNWAIMSRLATLLREPEGAAGAAV